MTRVLVTVGTTPFPSLVRFFDKSFSSHYSVTIQHADGPPPNHVDSFPFADNIGETYSKSDIVVTHAGAGSVFQLLEMGKRLIVVPNFDRADRHQMDLADFLERQRLALVVRALDQHESPESLLKAALVTTLEPYQKVPFFLGPSLRELIAR